MEFLVQKENQRVFLNNKELLGVQIIQSTIEHGVFNGEVVGLNSSPPYSLSHDIARASVSYFILHQDLFLPYTGISGFDFFIVNPKNTNEIYGGLSGFVTNYNLQTQVGNTPRASVEIIFAKDFGRRQASDSQHLTNILNGNVIFPSVTESSQSTVLITGFNRNLSKTNAADFSISVNIRQYFILVKKYPTGVNLIEPINVNLTIDVNLKDAKIPSTDNLVFNSENEHILFAVKGKNQVETLAGFYFADMQFLNQGISSNLSVSNTTLQFNKKVFIKPNIVTNGLLWYYDSTNPNSYPGGGNGNDYWYDLSPEEKPANLYGMLSPQKTGYMYFSGKNQATNNHSLMAIDISNVNNEDRWSICFWMKSARISGVFFSFFNGPHLKAAQGNFYFNNSPGLDDSALLGKLTDTAKIGVIDNYYEKWTHVCLTTNYNINALFYLNGIRTLNASTGVYTFSTLGDTILTFGNPTGTIFTSSPFTGYLDRILVYNRLLSQTEVIENMNATRITE